MPAFLDTGLNVVDVRDVAVGHLLACEQGGSGERYILGSENLTLERIFGMLAKAMGQAGAEDAGSLCGGVCRGGGFDGVGGSNGERAAGASRWGEDGAQEDVGAAG